MGEAAEEAAAVAAGEREESVSWPRHFGGVWARTKETCKVTTEEEPLSGDGVGNKIQALHEHQKWGGGSSETHH